MLIRAQPLTPAAFEPYGQVLAYRPGDPGRRNFAAELFNGRASAAPNLRVQQTQPTPLPLTLALIERHPHSSQTFAPISGGQYLVVVFPSDADADPVLSGGQAFIAEGDQAVNYNRGVWHHGFVALHRPGVFLMLRWDGGDGVDEEFLPLSAAIRVED